MGSSVLIPAAASGVALSFDSSAALEASSVSKASAGNFFGFSGHNTKATAQFIQIHNASSLPADTAVPIISIRAEANRNFSYDTGVHPINCTTGIVICNSSTSSTKTIGSADCLFTVVYK